MHTTARPTAAVAIGDAAFAADALTGVAAVPSVAASARRAADDALASAGIRILEAHDQPATERVADVLSRIWGRDDGMIDPALLVAMAHAGNPVGLVVPADRAPEVAADAPLGAAVGFCGPPGMPFHSHIVGLLPDAVGRGRGRAVKLAQRAWCLERGIEAMTWTYDPLVARNAYFNVRRLGAAALAYLPDFYGVMTDAINAGQHSDRVLIRWDLLRTPPAPGAAASPAPLLDGAAAAVADLDGAPTTYVPPTDPTRPVTVAVPADVERLRGTDPALARRWRLETRAAFTDLLASGWSITDVTRSGQYVLRRAHRPAPEGPTPE
ncbi:hypothetical protein [Agromyces sp. GXS1127]|uniref:hypothetical protein n=1 Tax=Agromyces sp. GXS1127 TaxID=3424181 RepID=UPI003D3213D2